MTIINPFIFYLKFVISLNVNILKTNYKGTPKNLKVELRKEPLLLKEVIRIWKSLPILRLTICRSLYVKS